MDEPVKRDLEAEATANVIESKYGKDIIKLRNDMQDVINSKEKELSRLRAKCKEDYVRALATLKEETKQLKMLKTTHARLGNVVKARQAKKA